MSLKNTLSLLLRNSCALFGVRLVRLASTKVRGIDPLLDLKFLLKNKPDPVILDVGANDGEMASEFLQTFPRARIVAFEPFEECYKTLHERFRDDSRVRVENIALGAAAGTSVLNTYSGNRMNSLLQLDEQPENIMKDKFASTGKAEIKIATLDDFCQSNGIRFIDVLKVDTQGYDLNVLKGASSMLKEHRVKVILLEINFIPMYKQQASFTELHDFLSGHGYRFVDFYNQVHQDGYTAWCDGCYVAIDTNVPAGAAV